MMDRIRDSIGELMSDEDLKKIIERGIEKALFERKEVSDGWRNTKVIPSFVDTMVEKLLKDRMDEAIRAWLKENNERVQTAVDEAVKIGAGGCLITALNTRFEDVFMHGIEDLKSRGWIKPQQP